MKQRKVSKNTKLVSNENFEDFSNPLLSQYLVKGNKDYENNLSKFHYSNPWK